VRLLRRSLVDVTARLGREPQLEREAVALAGRWPEDPSAADPDLVPTLLGVAGGAADRVLFDRLRDEALRTTDRERRERLLGGLGAGLCANSTHQEMEGFFKERSASVAGGPRILAQALEDVDQCVARKTAQQPSLVTFLEGRPAS
jgi:hypothetical protein